MTDLRYPIGPFAYDGRMTDARRRECIGRIAAAPGRLRAAVAGLERSYEQVSATHERVPAAAPRGPTH